MNRPELELEYYELSSSEMLLGDFFPNGPVLNYIFDLGACWTFDLKCKVVKNADPNDYPKPVIVKKVGDDIDQYPDTDDFFDC
jgi:hypothetical protein